MKVNFHSHLYGETILVVPRVSLLHLYLWRLSLVLLLVQKEPVVVLQEQVSIWLDLSRIEPVVAFLVQVCWHRTKGTRIPHNQPRLEYPSDKPVHCDPSTWDLAKRECQNPIDTFNISVISSSDYLKCVYLGVWRCCSTIALVLPEVVLGGFVGTLLMMMGIGTGTVRVVMRVIPRCTKTAMPTLIKNNVINFGVRLEVRYTMSENLILIYYCFIYVCMHFMTF